MKKKLAIVGGGTAGLFLAAFVKTEFYDVTIYEKKASLGRKFLVAGDGGFNLTHAEDHPDFKLRYTPTGFLNQALDHFTNVDFRAWLLTLDIPTFVGSSKRVFPEKGIKPIEVLKRIESHLKESKVQFEFNKTFTHWNEDGKLAFNQNELIESDFAVFALGGGSWKVTGSDGDWLNVFKEKGIETSPFSPSNCAYKIDWQKEFIDKHEGQPLKNLSISINGKTQKGEAVITRFGIEGNAIYGLSPEIRTELALKNEAIVHIDFKPTLELSVLSQKLARSNSKTTEILKNKIKLTKPVLDLIKSNSSKEQFLDPKSLAQLIKSFPIKLTGTAPIDEAISTTGGISLNAVSPSFELMKLKNTFCIGEMLNWDAPTGGYLIQACASSGVYLAKHLNQLAKSY